MLPQNKQQPVDPERFLPIFAPLFFRYLYRTHLGFYPDSRGGERWLEGLIDILIDSALRYYHDDIPATLTEKEAAVVFELLWRPYLSDKLSHLNEMDVHALLSVENFEHHINNILVHQLPPKFPNDRMLELLHNAWDQWRPRVAVLSPNLIASITTVYAEYIDWLKKHPKAIDTIAWEAFEKLIAEIFASKGFHVDLTGRMRNCSSDIIAIRTDEFGIETKYLIECKKWSGKRRIGLDVVNGVIGAAKRADADHAFLVTSSAFSEDVVRLRDSNHFRDMRLHLADGGAVQEWLNGYSARNDGGIWLAVDWDQDAQKGSPHNRH